MTADEQRLFRLYGKLPNKKDLLQNKLKVSFSPTKPVLATNPIFPAGAQILRQRRLRSLQSRQSLRHRRHLHRSRTPCSREDPSHRTTQPTQRQPQWSGQGSREQQPRQGAQFSSPRDESEQRNIGRGARERGPTRRRDSHQSIVCGLFTTRIVLRTLLLLFLLRQDPLSLAKLVPIAYFQMGTPHAPILISYSKDFFCHGFIESGSGSPLAFYRLLHA